MGDDVWELERMATLFDEQCGRLRTRASLVRAGASSTWEGPGAAKALDVLARRCTGLTEVAERLEGLAHLLRALAREVDRR